MAFIAFSPLVSLASRLDRTLWRVLFIDEASKWSSIFLYLSFAFLCAVFSAFFLLSPLSFLCISLYFSVYIFSLSLFLFHYLSLLLIPSLSLSYLSHVSSFPLFNPSLYSIYLHFTTAADPRLFLLP